MNPSLYYTSL